MGQYHYIANVDRKEYLDPHVFGSGLKAVEQVGFYREAGVGAIAAAFYLMSQPVSRGGGDFDDGLQKGRWHGQRVVVIGDYAEPWDFSGCDPKFRETYRDISGSVVEEFARQAGVVYVGKGWKSIFSADLFEASGVDLKKFANDSLKLSPSEIARLMEGEATDSIGEMLHDLDMIGNLGKLPENPSAFDRGDFERSKAEKKLRALEVAIKVLQENVLACQNTINHSRKQQAPMSVMMGGPTLN